MIAERFTYEEEAVEIHLDEQGERFVIRARRQDGTPVNGFEYSVDKITQIDAGTISTLDPIRELVQIARADVENDLWGKLSAACQSISNN